MPSADMNYLKLSSPLKPTGDQPEAILALTQGLNMGIPFQTLMGVTGSGKTFSLANVIENHKKPTLILIHNKTLAAQLYEEFRRFFPNNSIHYFVSYFDYYQPEAYIPQSDTYIQKDSNINEELDRLRHATAQAILTRNDVIVIASVSAIYGLGSPIDYDALTYDFSTGSKATVRGISEKLVSLQYERNDIDPKGGTFRIRGGDIRIIPPTGDGISTIRIDKGEIAEIAQSERGVDDPESTVRSVRIFPGRFWVSQPERIPPALKAINAELNERLKELKKQKKILEAERIGQRTRADMALIKETGTCHGIENYSLHLDKRTSGTPPFTLIDYFNYIYKNNNWLLLIDESHQTIPQLRGMVKGDLSRKNMLIEHGFRLPSARDNRPLTFEEFSERIGQVIFSSATPGPYEFDVSRCIHNTQKVADLTQKSAPRGSTETQKGFVEQLIRPTGLLDPTIEIRKTEGQLLYLVNAVKERIAKGQRVLITTLTKRLAEELTTWFKERDISVEYLHSDVKTLERPEILHKLRAGEVDVVIGINLLREGLDLPEVSLVAILDADQEGFLRNETTLIQVMGRAARHIDGHAVLFADRITHSMRAAISETNRRREIQKEYNLKYDITPRTVQKSLKQLKLVERHEQDDANIKSLNPSAIKELRHEMKKASSDLNFEKAAKLRNIIKKLSK